MHCQIQQKKQFKPLEAQPPFKKNNERTDSNIKEHIQD